MSDDDDPMDLVDQQQDEVVDRSAGYHIDPSVNHMAAASESAELVVSNDHSGLDELDRNYSWLDFV